MQRAPAGKKKDVQPRKSMLNVKLCISYYPVFKLSVVVSVNAGLFLRVVLQPPGDMSRMEPRPPSPKGSQARLQRRRRKWMDGLSRK